MTFKRTAQKSTTIADVAREAGVATMTVSRFLNHRPNISEQTSRKVAAAIRRLGYSPNLAARMLMGQPSNTIGLIVPNLADSFFAEVAHNIQEAARERDVLVWVAASNSDPNQEISLVQQMHRHHVDGILLIPTSQSKVSAKVKDGPPIVALDRPLPGRDTDTVVVQNRRASLDAADHLIQHGYKRIVCISADRDELYTIRERIAGYEDAMRRSKLKTEIATAKQTIADARKFLKTSNSKRKPIEAIFTTNNVTTIHVIEALDELGLRIPEDIALIGFDDFELAAFSRLSVTVVRQPAADLGRHAARLLFERIGSGEDTKRINISLPASLILRESCGCPARSIATARKP